MPPDERDDLLEVIKQSTKQGKELLGSFAQYRATIAAADELNKNLKSSISAFVGVFSEIQDLQARAVKDLGLVDFNNQINQAFKTFEDLNKSINNFGITSDNVKNTLFELTKGFQNSGLVQSDAINSITRAISENTNLVERSKLVKFVQDFSFQSNMGAKAAQQFENRLIGLSVALRRPPDTLMNLTQGLLTSNATFAQSADQLEKLALRAEAVGRSLGIAGENFNKMLGSTFTIQQRQQQAAVIGRLANQLRMRVDTTGILSSDPNKRAAALQNIILSFSRQTRGMDANVRQAVAFALQGTALGQMGPEAIRAIVSGRRLTIADLQGTQPADLDAARRGAATAAERIATRAEALRIGQARVEAETIFKLQAQANMGLAGLATKADKVFTDMGDRIGEIAGSSARAVVGVAGALVSVLSQIDRLMAGRSLDDTTKQILRGLKTDLLKLQSEVAALR